MKQKRKVRFYWLSFSFPCDVDIMIAKKLMVIAKDDRLVCAICNTTILSTYLKEEISQSKENQLVFGGFCTKELLFPFGMKIFLSCFRYIRNLHHAYFGYIRGVLLRISGVHSFLHQYCNDMPFRRKKILFTKEVGSIFDEIKLFFPMMQGRRRCYRP